MGAEDMSIRAGVKFRMDLVLDPDGLGRVPTVAPATAEECPLHALLSCDTDSLAALPGHSGIKSAIVDNQRYTSLHTLQPQPNRLKDKLCVAGAGKKRSAALGQASRGRTPYHPPGISYRSVFLPPRHSVVSKVWPTEAASPCGPAVLWHVSRTAVAARQPRAA
jgi:hypothetical protein